MINEEKVKELFHVAVYDSKDNRVDKQAASYYGWDYLWKEGLKSFFTGTFAFAGLVVLWMAINAEDLINRINDLDFQSIGITIGVLYVAFLAVAVSITCLVCAAYVHLQADITTRMSNISALEKEIADLKTDNDTTLKRVNTSINLNEIKEKAIAELGMVYAAPDQIAYYSIEDSDYMTQYEEIPGK